MDDDCPRKPRDPLGNSGDPLDLTDLTQHIPASAPPITRSLSKSSLRDPSQKHPPPPRAQVIDRAEDDISVQPSTTVNETCGEHAEDLHLLPKDSPSLRVRTSIAELPTEVLDSIVSHVGGQLGSATSSGNAGGNWSSRLRHPRRKDITNLALVSPEWRSLVQERIFRHSRHFLPPSSLQPLTSYSQNPGNPAGASKSRRLLSRPPSPSRLCPTSTGHRTIMGDKRRRCATTYNS